MPRIFLSYRREDAAADANALYQSLCSEFGKERLFKDVDNVPLGANWKTAVKDAVRESTVLLVVMGPRWEFSGAIQIELATAFREGIPVIPLLVGGARMEDVARDLSGDVLELTDLNAARLDHDSWTRDLLPVLDALHELLGSDRLASQPSPPPQEPTDEAQPPAATEARTEAGQENWSAALTDSRKGVPASFTITLQLTNREFMIVWKQGLVRNSVQVDGVTVSARVGISHERHSFELRDGEVTRMAHLDAFGTVDVREVTLKVDNRQLLSVEPPRAILRA